ncbi:hypothetical protein B0T21DRAFT_448343 [Apiosordaria backusii]|uniref:DNA replication factor Cdt1 C-terminal domain-containing protein n=1 Tax=Apiosordaria backusii TaxID=314023 RepID=A0AA40ETQ9_9PEZI|nr:hypothetical protein B0T21DRAFT_448343 [Apiosordaria backusii]
MPGVISRKTRSAASTRGTKNPPATSSIANFTKISKLQTLGKDVAAEKKKATTDTIFGRTSNIEIVLTSKKRKVEDEGDSTPKKQRREPEARPIATATPVSRKKKTVSFALPENAAPAKPTPTPSRAAPVSTPSRKRSHQADDDSDSSSTQTSSLLERLNIQSPLQKKRTKTVAALPAQNDFDLPQELLDLLDMQAAFLKSLSMQYAHNGTNSPIDLRDLYPSITRTWGKRQVTVADIQRLLGVLNWSPAKPSPTAPFLLSDYGRAKICIDFSPSLPAGPIREAKLNMDFESNLRTLWLSSNKNNVTLFLGTLPKAAIKKCESLIKAAIPKQTTLDSLKAGIQARKEAELAAKEEAAKKVDEAVKPDGTRMSLLERIKMKEEEMRNVSEGPTPEELQRRAALQRAGDVAAVIGMLCKASGGRGQARVSFTMQQVLGKVKDSLRTPVSGEDAGVCVRLLAMEVTPEWIRVVKVGGGRWWLVRGLGKGEGRLE